MPLNSKSAREIIIDLELERHDEGGWFRETYKSLVEVDCPERAGYKRPALTVIQYLLEQSAPRALLHRNLSDIVHFHQAGGLLRYLTWDPREGLRENLVGPGYNYQLVVRGGVWKATELVVGTWALVGEAVTPGFDYRDRKVATLNDIHTAEPSVVECLSIFLPQEPAGS